MSDNQKDKNPIYRNYLKKSCDMLTERDMFEITAALTGIRTPQKLFDRFGSYRALLSEPGNCIVDTIAGGEKLASLLKLIRDCAWTAGTEICEASYAEEKLKILEDEMKMSAQLRATSEFLRSVSPEHINELCISLAEKSYNPERETIWASYLDRKNRIIEECFIGAGNYGASSLNLRTLIKPAFKNNATAMLIAHSHPDGTLEPSRSDIATTDKISLICDALGINLIDHIIVVPGKYKSIMYPQKKAVSFYGNRSDFEKQECKAAYKTELTEKAPDETHIFEEISEKNNFTKPISLHEKGNNRTGNEFVAEYLNKADAENDVSVFRAFTENYNSESNEGNIAWDGNVQNEAISEYAKHYYDTPEVCAVPNRSALQSEADEAYSRARTDEADDFNIAEERFFADESDYSDNYGNMRENKSQNNKNNNN